MSDQDYDDPEKKVEATLLTKKSGGGDRPAPGASGEELSVEEIDAMLDAKTPKERAAALTPPPSPAAVAAKYLAALDGSDGREAAAALARLIGDAWREIGGRRGALRDLAEALADPPATGDGGEIGDRAGRLWIDAKDAAPLREGAARAVSLYGSPLPGRIALTPCRGDRPGDIQGDGDRACAAVAAWWNGLDEAQREAVRHVLAKGGAA